MWKPMMYQNRRLVCILLAVTFGAVYAFLYTLDIPWTTFSCSSNNIAYSPDVYTMSVRKAINKFKPLRLPANTTRARPFLRGRSWYRLSPRYNLSFCLIEKSMSMLLQSIFCYLYDPTGFVENNRTISKEYWHERFCANRNEISSTREKYLAAPFNPPTIFIVRNPYERFISAFVNKCMRENAECYGCPQDLLCVIEKAHSDIMKINADYWNIHISTEEPELKHSYEAQHFSPSTWKCDLADEAENYIFIKYGEADDAMSATFAEIVKLFEAHGVEKTKINYILESVKERNLHATKETGLREKYFEKLKASPKHIQLLNDLYYYDNTIFGFQPM